MQTNPGDVTIDMAFAWLRAGAKLDSLTGVTILAFVLRLFVVPLLESIVTKHGVMLCGKYLLYAAFACSFLIVFAIDLLTKSHLPFVLILGIAIAVTWQAVGIHQTGKQIKKPSDTPCTDDSATTSAAN